MSRSPAFVPDHFGTRDQVGYGCKVRIAIKCATKKTYFRQFRVFRIYLFQPLHIFSFRKSKTCIVWLSSRPVY